MYIGNRFQLQTQFVKIKTNVFVTKRQFKHELPKFIFRIISYYIPLDDMEMRRYCSVFVTM